MGDTTTEPQDETQPLWLPAGSVRAVLALVVIGGAIVMQVAVGAVPEWLQPLAGAAFGYYFGARGGR